MYEDMGRYRCVRIREDADVKGHGRIQMCNEMLGYRCSRIWEDADV